MSQTYQHPLFPVIGINEDGDVSSDVLKVSVGSKYITFTEGETRHKLRSFGFAHDCFFGIANEDVFIYPQNKNYSDLRKDNFVIQSYRKYLGCEGRRHAIYDNFVIAIDGRIIDRRDMTDRPTYISRESRIPLVNFNRTQRIAAQVIYETFEQNIKTNEQIYYLDDDVTNNSLNNLNVMTPEARKDMIAEKLSREKGGKRHPVLTDFVAFEDGKIYSLCREKFLDGYKKESGYLRVSKLEVHKMVYEAFHGLVDGKTHHVDHINNIHDDNRLANLQKLSVKAHTAKTMSDSPAVGRKTGISLSKPLLRIKKDKDGNIIEQRSFKNGQEAVEATRKEHPDKFISLDNLSPRVDTNETYKGYFWKYETPRDLPGELWKSVNLPGVSLKASTAGRIEFPNERRTLGTRTEKVKYMKVEHKNRTYQVHFLVCVAFHLDAHPTSLLDKTITPDHINQQSDDNRPENLRWATKRQQVLNQAFRDWIVAIDKNTNQDIRVFECIKDAAKYFSLGYETVKRRLSEKTSESRVLSNITFVRRSKS